MHSFSCQISLTSHKLSSFDIIFVISFLLFLRRKNYKNFWVHITISISITIFSNFTWNEFLEGSWKHVVVRYWMKYIKFLWWNNNEGQNVKAYLIYFFTIYGHKISREENHKNCFYFWIILTKKNIKENIRRCNSWIMYENFSFHLDYKIFWIKIANYKENLRLTSNKSC